MKKSLLVGFVALSVVTMIIMGLMARPNDEQPYSPGNFGPEGLAGFFAVLEHYGVEPSVKNGWHDVVATSDANTTVAFPADEVPEAEDLERLLDSGARVILFHRGVSYVSEVWGFDGDFSWYSDGAFSECDDADATAAGLIGPSEVAYVGAESGCFPADDGYLWVQSETYENLFLFAGTKALTNEHLDEAGNAAFGVRKFGANQKLVWLNDPRMYADGSYEPSVVPSWLSAASWAALLTGLWACVYAARRFGKLVAEPLPVAVPAAETDLGRALLYQRGNSIGHAAQVLRSDFIDERARRLGITATTTPEEVSCLIARSLNYSPQQMHDLLFSRRISTESDLVSLADELAILKKESTHVPVL